MEAEGIKDIDSTKSRKILLGILVLSLALRFALLGVAIRTPDRAILPDTGDYLKPALALLETGIYPADNGARTPVYPLFIALIYGIFGQNLPVLVATQCVLSTFNVLLTYWIAKRFLPSAVAVIGALFMAVSLISVTYSFFLVTETLFTFLLLISTWFWIRATQGGSKRWMVLAGAGMGLAVLCRPIGLYYPFLLVLIALFERKIAIKQRLVRQVLFWGIFLIVLVPWVLRNKSVAGVPTISTISSVNLYYFNVASLEANLRGIGEAELRTELLERATQKLADAGLEDTMANRVRLYNTLALQTIRAHPLRYLYLHLKSDLNSLIPELTGLTEIMGLTVGGRGTLSILNQYGLRAAIQNYFGDQVWLLWLFAPILLIQGVFYLFGLIGAVATIKRRDLLAVAVLILPVLYFLLLPGAVSLPRFRVPATPALCLLAGQGLFSSIEVLYKKRKLSQRHHEFR